MYEDTKDFIRRCRNCHKQGGITARIAMPLTYNLQVELFDVWGIDYMGPFPKSQNCEYILVTMDYVSKWVEAIPYRAADAKHACKMFHEIIFPWFGTPRMVISDEVMRTSSTINHCQRRNRGAKWPSCSRAVTV